MELENEGTQRLLYSTTYTESYDTALSSNATRIINMETITIKIE